MDERKPLTPQEQWAEFHHKDAVFQRDYKAWNDSGRQGPPPPRPIKPHTPGWNS